jgi:hypothetical protein
VNPREERAAKNEALFRAVNREIEQAAEEVGDGELEVLCECGRDGCHGTIALTSTEYDRVHVERDRFVVLPGHETLEIENVVDRTDRYVVVDKFGEAEDVVEESGDPGPG